MLSTRLWIGSSAQGIMCEVGIECVQGLREGTDVKRILVAFATVTLGLVPGKPVSTAAQAPQSETVTIDAQASAQPFPHYWERMFGSGRAILSLRESYRRDLRTVKEATGFEYIRFHAIFHDEVGLYDEDPQGRPIYNFSYVDQVYDGLLQNGIRPFVELSFMPRQLAAKPILQPFWYRPNVSPPKDWDRWGALVEAFVHHLVDRYGVDEVSSWYFEVWNEPNIDFWAGEPKQQAYFELYDHTARALKSISPAFWRLGTCNRSRRLGGLFHCPLRSAEYPARFPFHSRLRG